MTPTGLLVLLRSGDEATLDFALEVVGTALGAREPVTLSLFGAGLEAFLAMCRGQRVEDAARRQRLDLLRQLAAYGVELRVVACSGAVEALREVPERLVTGGHVDAVLGLPTIWREAAGRRLLSL